MFFFILASATNETPNSNIEGDLISFDSIVEVNASNMDLPSESLLYASALSTPGKTTESE